MGVRLPLRAPAFASLPPVPRAGGGQWHYPAILGVIEVAGGQFPQCLNADRDMPLPRKCSSGEMEPPKGAVPHEQCWAKTTESGHPGISVAQHCRTAGIVARLLAERAPAWLQDAMRMDIGSLLAALHDIGKVCPGFQAKCRAWRQEHGLSPEMGVGSESDHAQVSQKTLLDLLLAGGADDHLRFWAAIVGAHHGKLKSDRIPLLHTDGGEPWAAERRRLAEELIREFGPLPDQPPPGLTPWDCASLWFNAGLVAVADWLASDERSFPPSKTLDAAALRERAEKQLDRIGFQPIAIPPGKSFTDLFPFQPNPLQELFTAAVRRPGVYVVEASMGCGKTEAALIAAYGLLASGQATGIYFALPTQVTSNRIHRRVDEFLAKLGSVAKPRLIHGNSWLLTADPSLTDSRNGDTKEWTGRDWFASPRRALLAPFGVGTVDQALLGVVAAKHFFVRQFALAGKVVILDEVHSYDLYTGTLLDLLVPRLRELGATVIILSATLTAARRGQLLGLADSAITSLASEYPLFSASVSGGNGGDPPAGIIQTPVPPEPPKSIRLQFKGGADLAAACLERARRGACVLWIRNTVADAQDSYRQLCGQNQAGGPEVALLHARFPQFRREQLENDWLDRLGKDGTRRPNGCVLVSTQVAEQSVDIDADLLVSDLAPTDMLLQRLGRLWRHPRPRPAGCAAPEAWIAAPALAVEELGTAAEIKAAFGKSGKVYAPYVLLRTFELWHKRTELTLPTAIRPLLEATYAEREPAAEPPAWRELRTELEKRREKLRTAALASSNPWQVQLDDEEGVQTRWNSSPAVSVLIVRKVSARETKSGACLELLDGSCCNLRNDGDFNLATAQAIHRNLVKVHRWCVKPFLSSNPPAWLWEYVHDAIITCKLCDGKLLALPGDDDTKLSYREDLGVVTPPWTPLARPVQTGTEEDDDESYD
ncbi:MAG: CRISPR-associated helicase Cas3' [Lentisphaeria bacterium]